jgi:hypothetical protein
MVAWSNRGDHCSVGPAFASDAWSVRPLESPVGEWKVSLEDVLETIEEFGKASLDLIAWEFSVPVEAVADSWEHAVEAGLLRPVGTADSAGEQMYVIATPGRVAARASAYRPA